jgi:galactose mutarotase-like enzyme
MLQAAGMLFIFCASFLGKNVERRIRVFSFGNAKYGEPINRYLLANERGTEAAIINYGADVVFWRVPDRDGKVADVVLGYDDLGGFEADKSCFGASIGRYGNRIAARQFTLDGSVFRLPKNDGPNCLHGRTRGFNKRVSTGVDASRPDAQVLELTYTSPDGDETVRAKVTFTLPVDKNELRIDYSATTDKDTVVNLTNHSYFNLTGVPAQAIADHQLLLRAARFTPVDATRSRRGKNARLQAVLSISEKRWPSALKSAKTINHLSSVKVATPTGSSRMLQTAACRLRQRSTNRPVGGCLRCKQPNQGFSSTAATFWMGQ